MRLWRLRSSTICCLQAGDPGKQVVCIPVPAKGLRSRSVSSVSPMRIRDPCLGSSRWAEIPTDTHCLSLETELSEPGTGLGALFLGLCGIGRGWGVGGGQHPIEEKLTVWSPQPGLKYQLKSIISCRTLAKPAISLCLSFLIWKMGIIMPTPKN